MADKLSSVTRAITEGSLKQYIDETLEGAGALRGIGIDDTQVVNGHLIVTYDNGTTEDAGALPQVPLASNESF